MALEGRFNPNHMTKAELVSEVVNSTNTTRQEADVIVDTVLDSIVSSLTKGEKVELRGFGSFRTRQRPARQGRNPRSGEMVEVPSKTIPFFKASKQLRDAVGDSEPTE